MKPLKKKDSPHDLQDLGYKEFFSFIKLFEQLIEGYIEGEWKAFLDYKKAQRIEKSFVSRGFKRTEADILYRVPFLKNPEKSIHLYVLIEHQSSVDHKMALRVYHYLGEIWKYVVKNTAKREYDRADFRLPPILPIVLYNGKENWTAKTKLREIIEGSEYFEKYIPNVEYHLVDIPRIGREKLEKLRNSLSAIFLLEKAGSYEELEERLKKAFEFLEEEEHEGIVQLILEWFVYHVKVHLRQEEAQAFYLHWSKKQKNPQEMKKMLELTLEKIKQEIKLEGKEEGLQEGIQKGKEEGLQEGIQKGKEEGLQEGIQEGAVEELRKNILRVLEKRGLKRISSPLKQKLKGISEKKVLEEVFDLALTLADLKDFEKALPPKQ
jgi:predicted transposase/invertase (TIGR01784 family)